MTYKEVIDEIPYRNLIIMAKDKLHVTYGEVKEEVSDEEFFRMKGIKLSK